MAMRRTTRFGFILLWAAVAIGAAVLAWFWTGDADFVGIVETRTHKLGAREAGRVRQVMVSLGDEVEANQLLALLDMADLEHERDWINAELQGLEASLDADRARYGLEYDRLRLQGDASAAGLRERRAELEAKRGELAALNGQVARLEAAERSGLGRSRDLDDLVVRRDAAARFVREAGASESPSTVPARALTGAPRADDIVRSLMSERLDRASGLRLRLKEIDDRMDRRRIISPCRGHVVKVDGLPGDAVEPFVPLLTVEEPNVAFVDVYIPETSDFQPRMGQRVRVLPHRTGAQSSRGTIVFIDPGYAAVPQRLAFRNILYWARKFRVRLDDGHRMMPGEAARVEVLSEFLEVPPAAASERSDADRKPAATPAGGVPSAAEEGPAPREMQVPAALRERARLEPSGLAWLPDLDRYLVASDDTGRVSEAAHAPWLFLMDPRGRLDPDPVVVEGAAALNDVEAIAARPDGALYLVSSGGVSAKGRRPSSRRMIHRVARTGRTMRVTAQADFVDAVARSLDPAGRAALGLPADDAALEGLEIEGAAWVQGALLLGLKGPRPADGALLWRLEDPDALLQQGALRPGQLTLAARVDLRTRDGRPAAFSDLAADAEGSLWALSTVPEPGAAGQEGALFRLGPTRDGRATPTRVRTFPGLKPEGLCPAADGGMAVVFDSDDRPPFLFLKTEPTAP
jgi:multidrug resistance efflux pump